MNSIYTLETWLSVATKNLAPQAVSSITKEITDHVKTTLERQTSAGLSQVEAEKLVVRLLGDPVVFLKNSRKIYLTTSEDKHLKQLYLPQKTGKWLHLLFFLFAIFSFFNLWHNSYPKFHAYTLTMLCYANWQIPYLLGDKISIKIRDKFWLIYQFISLILTLTILSLNNIRSSNESIYIDGKPDYSLKIFQQ